MGLRSFDGVKTTESPLKTFLTFATNTDIYGMGEGGFVLKYDDLEEMKEIKESEKFQLNLWV